MIIEPFSFIFLSVASFCTWAIIFLCMILVIASVVTSRLQICTFVTFSGFFNFIIFSYPILSLIVLGVASITLFNIFFLKKEENFRNKKK